MSKARDMLKKMKTMKTLPNVAVQLTRMIHDDTSSLQEFEEVIRLDPTLVLRLLKLVNSPYYALASKVESIAEAVAFVGMDNLRNLIVLDIFKHIIQLKSDGEDGFSRVRLWHHSAAVGVTSQMICERIFATKGENAFLGGLIHDIGLIIADQVAPEPFERAYQACMAGDDHITVYEARTMGCDHAQIGEAIARDWNLPREIREGVAQHHKTSDRIDPSSLTGMIQLAEYLTDRLEMSPFRGMVKALPQGLVNHMYKNIDEYKAVAADLPEIISKAGEVFGLEQDERS